MALSLSQIEGLNSDHSHSTITLQSADCASTPLQPFLYNTWYQVPIIGASQSCSFHRVRRRYPSCFGASSATTWSLQQSVAEQTNRLILSSHTRTKVSLVPSAAGLSTGHAGHVLPPSFGKHGAEITGYPSTKTNKMLIPPEICQTHRNSTTISKCMHETYFTYSM